MTEIYQIFINHCSTRPLLHDNEILPSPSQSASVHPRPPQNLLFEIQRSLQPPLLPQVTPALALALQSPVHFADERFCSPCSASRSSGRRAEQDLQSRARPNMFNTVEDDSLKTYHRLSHKLRSGEAIKGAA